MSRADPGRAEDKLGWKAQTHMKAVVRKLIEMG
jgi:GDP-D-mannose dehydratase